MFLSIHVQFHLYNIGNVHPILILMKQIDLYSVLPVYITQTKEKNKLLLGKKED